jgi:hypothetical protein
MFAGRLSFSDLGALAPIARRNAEIGVSGVEAREAGSGMYG